MSREILRVFNENMIPIGQKPREDVHQLGDWHETFHCWFTFLEGKEIYLLLQKRAAVKKDYPGLLDITSAGHLMADERVEDGTREVEEELGVKVSFEDLVSLGTIKGEIKHETIWDREICHMFLYRCNKLPAFQLQEEEVEAIYKVRLQDAINLFNGTVLEIDAAEIHPGLHHK